MTAGLPASRLIAVSINLAPAGATFANVNSLLVMGDSDIIDVSQRIRSYASITAVATDFGTTAPEYLAALNFFSQSPQPTQLYIGRWAQSATHGRLTCGILTATQQAIALWTAITNGSFKIQVDGGALTSITALDFHLATNLNGVATVINTALTTATIAATCAWVNDHFEFKSTATGAASTVAFLTGGAGGTDISATIKGTSTTAQRTVAGIVAESAAAAVVIMDNLTTGWYGLMFASTNIVDADHSAIAAYIEASSNKHIYGVTTQNTAALAAGDTTSIGYLLKAAGYQRSFVQYSSSSAYAVASMFGREFTVQFTGNNTVITLMYKNEPGVVAETLTPSQAAALDANRYNYFVNYDNNTAIIMNGMMAGPAFIDEIHGMDWLANRVQTDVYNLLYTSPTKIPQTDDGNHLIATTIEASCEVGVTNGLIAPGTWTVGGFGQLKQGDLLPKGYYVYAPPIANQAPADRAARKSVAFQVAVKLAGAVQTVNVAITVNR